MTSVCKRLFYDMHLNIMEDPYQYVETLDQRTFSYVKEKNAEFSKIFGDSISKIKDRVTEFIQTKAVIQALVSGNNYATLFRESQQYHVSLNNKTVYSSDNVILWINLSEDGTRLALFETLGSDMGTVKIISRGEIIQEIEGNISELEFTEDSFYLVKTYVEAPPPDGGELNSHRVIRGGDIVFGTGFDSTQFIHLKKSKGKLIADVGNWTQSSIYCGDLDVPKSWEKLYEFNSPVELVGIVNGEVCYLLKEGNGILKIGENTVVDFQSPVENVILVKDGFVVSYLEEAKINVSLYDFTGKKNKDFPLKEPMGLLISDSDEERAVMVFQSFGTPYSLWEYENSNLTLMEENRLLDLEIGDHFVQSTGARIHYFLVNPKNPDGKKVLVTGYGGFNISLTPRYVPYYATLLSEGITLVQANLRGGGEYGKKWHEDGMLERKQNVFDDFISVLDELKKHGYRIVAQGRSNGGLLVGAMVTQRPELLAGAVIGVPVLDMMRFHLMSVGKFWVTEFGNPENEDDAKVLMKYSPYHNINHREYPKTLIWGLWNDDRVHPAHGIKFHMKLSEYTENAFLRIGMSGGHVGISPLEEIQMDSDMCGFILECLDTSAERN